MRKNTSKQISNDLSTLWKYQNTHNSKVFICFWEGQNSHHTIIVNRKIWRGYNKSLMPFSIFIIWSHALNFILQNAPFKFKTLIIIIYCIHSLCYVTGWTITFLNIKKEYTYHKKLFDNQPSGSTLKHLDPTHCLAWTSNQII
jgi:hypothetical protein